jgi:membrane protease YdiL (CAAX protease family)
MSRRALWAEVGVVLAVEVVPRVIVPLTQPWPPAPPLLYGADTVSLTITSACTVFVVLYLITRAGEPWDRFGLDRPGGWDIPLGIGMLFVSYAVSLFYFRFGFLVDDPETYRFPRPAGVTGLAMGVVKFGAAGFMEELVFRAYLITRLETLLQSSWRALVVATLLFAAVHGYQGPAGVWFTFLFGLAYGGVYLGCRRLWPLAIGHALTNLVLEYSR